MKINGGITVATPYIFSRITIFLFGRCSPMTTWPPDRTIGVLKPGKYYIIYLKNGGSSALDLAGQSGGFNIQWFNPRKGDQLKTGTISSITGGSKASIGNPLSAQNKDWVVLISR